MESILKLLYDAELGDPMDALRQDPGFAGASQRKQDLLKQLTETLTPEQKTLLETYNEASSRVEDMVAFQKFTYGFQLGILLTEAVDENREALLF